MNRQDVRVPPRMQTAIWTVFALGVLLQCFLGWRGQIGGDQALLLDLGRRYADSGELAPVAKAMSGGAVIPGSLLQVLIGLPLEIWSDHRAPVVVIGCFHILAGLLLMRTMRKMMGGRFALVFMLVFWLSPWRLYHSGILWEPAYLMLPAALHFWCCSRLRTHPARWPTLVLTMTLVLTAQLHGSFLLLWIFTALLYFRRHLRICWWAGLGGILAGLIPAFPMVCAMLAGSFPQLVSTQGFYGYGLATFYPILRGLMYWFRMGSLDIGRLKRVAFLEPEWVGHQAERYVVFGATHLLFVLAIASVALSIWSSWWFFRRAPRMAGWDADWRWLHTYALYGLIAVLGASALAPVAIQGWHVVIALHAAALPVTAYLVSTWPARARWLRWAIVLFILLRIPETLVLAFGHASYCP